MAQNPPEGTPRILARLAYDDVAAAVAFLERAFGFREAVDARLEEPDGSIFLTEITVVDSRVMIGLAGGHGIVSPKTTGVVTQGLIVYLDDLDGHCQRARDAGAEIVSEPADQFWGDRRYEAEDLEGHLWSFHQHVRDVPPAEIRAAIRTMANN